MLKKSLSGPFQLPVILSVAKNLKALKEILRHLRLLRMTTERFSTVCKEFDKLYDRAVQVKSLISGFIRYLRSDGASGKR